jgi:2-dehydro-3-deoxyglucarate aldolase
MNKLRAIHAIRNKMKRGQPTIGSWMQIPHGSVAEIMGAAGYDWVAVDMEHGSVGVAQLPDLFRALELGNTLPLVRVAEGAARECQQALDAGAGGIIVPNIKSADYLIAVRDACRWPPAGKRGVGFSRANLFGSNFRSYTQEAQAPLLVAMLEDVQALDELDSILAVEGLDAVLLGPYDLSASLHQTAKFDHPHYLRALKTILRKAQTFRIPLGIHVVEPSTTELKKRIRQGFRFLPFSMDSVLLRKGLEQKI